MQPMTTRIILLFISLGFLSQVTAQERVSIQDPDLTFSYVLPSGWSNYDDDYYHYLLTPDSSVQITLTYFDGMCESLEDCYIGELQGKLRSEYTDFEVLDEKTDRISSVPARWASFTGKMDGVEVKAFAFFLISNEHFFKITAFMDPEVEESLSNLVIDTVRSLTVRLN